MALVARTHGPQDRPMAISNVLIGVGAGVVTAGAVGGFLASLFGPSSPYHIFALCLLLDAALFVCFVDVERYEHGIGKTIDEPGSKKADISFSEFWYPTASLSPYHHPCPHTPLRHLPGQSRVCQHLRGIGGWGALKGPR